MAYKKKSKKRTTKQKVQPELTNLELLQSYYEIEDTPGGEFRTRCSMCKVFFTPNGVVLRAKIKFLKENIGTDLLFCNLCAGGN